LTSRHLRCFYTGISLILLTCFSACGGSSPSKQITPPTATLQGISLTGCSGSLTIGATLQCTATGTYSDGTTKNITSTVTWTSSNAAVATVNSAGVITGAGAGTAVITGTLNGTKTTITVTISASLNTITISASSSTLTAGQTLQLSATGAYNDGSTVNLTGQATWISSDPTIATVSAGGLVTAIAPGTVQISATLNGVSGASSIQVQPSLTSIGVLPANPAIELHTTQQLMASGNYSDGSQQDLTNSVVWSSSLTTIATIDQKGLASAVSSGTSTMTAVLNGTSGSTALTVHPPHLVSIVIDQAGMTEPLGLTQQLSATGTFSDSSTAPLTGVIFTSSDESIVSVDANGLASTHTVGAVTLTATVGSVGGTGAFTVGPQSLVSIAVSPTNPSIPLGLHQQFTVTGTFTDSSTQQLTSGITWGSSDQTVVTVDLNGVATSVGIGSTSITANVGTLSSSSSITVTAAQLASIAVTPAATSVPVGSTQPFTATGTYTDQSTQDLSSTATWMSSDGTMATIDITGLATGIAAGTVTITATSGSVSGTASLQVTLATLVSFTISPLDQTAVLGTQVQFSATGTFSDGSTRVITRQTQWSSSIPATVSVNNLALATAHKLGKVTITASYGSQTVTTTLTVVSLLP
jgi:trimeric autotransporter adhesin